MGLDSYLNRMPRYKGVTAEQISAMESWFDYQTKREDGNEHANCTFKEWCGYDENILPSKGTIEYFKQFYTIKYSHWDTEHKYGYGRIMEQVGYWRKANEIHNWFVENVQNSVDDCDYHNEVTKEVLESLRDTCIKVLEASKLVDGKVECGYTFDANDNRVYDYEDGLVVEDSTVAEELLPTTSGFFFGGTSYDKYYIDDLKQTVAIIDKVLEETDFETQMIYYVSSW